MRPHFLSQKMHRRAREEDSFNGSKGNETFSKHGLTRITPCKGPVSFVTNTGVCLDAVEMVPFHLFVIYICVDQEGVHFIVNIFHHNLKTIETTCLRILNFIHEVLTHVFIHNAKDLENVFTF